MGFAASFKSLTMAAICDPGASTDLLGMVELAIIDAMLKIAPEKKHAHRNRV